MSCSVLVAPCVARCMRRLRRFCSAFADTDVPFGSLGNFFSFAPHGLAAVEVGRLVATFDVTVAFTHRSPR